MMMTARSDVKSAKEAAVDLVLQRLGSLPNVNSGGLRELNLKLAEQQRLSIVELQVLIAGIISKLDEGRRCLISAEKSVMELNEVADKFKVVGPPEILLGSTHDTRLVSDFLSIYQNISIVYDLTEKLSLFNKHLNKIKESLDTQGTEESSDIPGFEFSILYRMLLISQELRNRISEQSRTKSCDISFTKKILDRFFIRLDNLKSDFETKYWMLTRRVLDLLLKGECDPVRNLLGVIEMQEDGEPDFFQQKKGLGKSTDGNNNSSYMKKFSEVISASVRGLISNLRQETGLNLSKTLHAGYKMIIGLIELPEARSDEPTTLQSLIKTCAIEMHDRLHRAVSSTCTSSDIPADSVIECLHIISNYRHTLESAFEESPMIKNTLLAQVDSLQKALCAKYSKLEFENAHFLYNSIVTERLSKGSNGIKNADIAKELDDEIFFQIKNILASGSSILVSTALELLRDVLLKYNSDVSVQLNIIMTKTANAASDYIPDDVEPMLIAMCRDSFAVSSCVQKKLIPCIEAAIEGMRESEHVPRVQEQKSKIKSLSAQLAQTARKYADTVCSVVIARMSPVEGLLFTTKWYETDVIQFAIGVITDTLALTEGGLDPEIKDLIVRKTLKETVNFYINAIVAKQHILKKQATQLIKSDAEALDDTFTELGIRDARTYTLPIHCLSDLLSATKPSMIASACKSFYESYEGCTADVLNRILESCVNCNEQLKKGIINKLVDSV